MCRLTFIRACEVANADSDILAIEAEWDSLNEPIEEPWTDAPPRSGIPRPDDPL